MNMSNRYRLVDREAFKRLRQILWTQDELGKKLGITSSGISVLESGKQLTISEDMYEKLCFMNERFRPLFRKDSEPDSGKVPPMGKVPVESHQSFSIRDKVVSVAQKKSVDVRAIELLPAAGPTTVDGWVQELKMCIETVREMDDAERKTEAMLEELFLESQIEQALNLDSVQVRFCEETIELTERRWVVSDLQKKFNRPQLRIKRSDVMGKASWVLLDKNEKIQLNGGEEFSG